MFAIASIPVWLLNERIPLDCYFISKKVANCVLFVSPCLMFLLTNNLINKWKNDKQAKEITLEISLTH